jgi:hypothetical protein
LSPAPQTSSIPSITNLNARRRLPGRGVASKGPKSH